MNNPRLQPYNEYEETEYERADQYEQVLPTKFQTNPNPRKYEYEPTN